MPRWYQLDESTREALREWYNCIPLDHEDRKRLADLYTKGLFFAWDCPECGTRILVGYPEDWGHFQGVRQSEHVGSLCADCGSTYLKLKEFAEG